MDRKIIRDIKKILVLSKQAHDHLGEKESDDADYVRKKLNKIIKYDLDELTRLQREHGDKKLIKVCVAIFDDVKKALRSLKTSEKFDQATELIDEISTLAGHELLKTKEKERQLKLGLKEAIQELRKPKNRVNDATFIIIWSKVWDSLDTTEENIGRYVIAEIIHYCLEKSNLPEELKSFLFQLVSFQLNYLITDDNAKKEAQMIKAYFDYLNDLGLEEAMKDLCAEEAPSINEDIKRGDNFGEIREEILDILTDLSDYFVKNLMKTRAVSQAEAQTLTTAEPKGTTYGFINHITELTQNIIIYAKQEDLDKARMYSHKIKNELHVYSIILNGTELGLLIKKHRTFHSDLQLLGEKIFDKVAKENGWDKQ